MADHDAHSIPALVRSILDDVRDLIREELASRRVLPWVADLEWVSADSRAAVHRSGGVGDVRSRTACACARAAKDARDPQGEPVVDAEHVAAEMRAKRTSIDRKIEALAAATERAKARALRRVIPVALAGWGAALLTVWWWRRGAARSTRQHPRTPERQPETAALLPLRRHYRDWAITAANACSITR
jgi:hypothetical protein